MTTTKDAQRAFATYGDMVYRLALVRVHGVAEAEDIVQEVFLRYLRSAPEIMDAEHEKAWLIRVAINCSKSQVSSVWNRRVDSLADESEQLLADSDRRVEETDGQTHVIRAAVQQLPEKYRTVVHLFYYEQYRTAQIATLMDAREATVRSWLHRARQLLRDTIDLSDEE